MSHMHEDTKAAGTALSMTELGQMQHDEHVWAWRNYRHNLRGFWAGLRNMKLYSDAGN